MTTTIHYGVIGDARHADLSSVPIDRFRDINYLFTDGDSFKVWGEDRKDLTLHIQRVIEDTEDLLLLIQSDRGVIASRLGYGWRLVDYVATSDTETWSENEKCYYLEHFD